VGQFRFGMTNEEWLDLDTRKEKNNEAIWESRRNNYGPSGGNDNRIFGRKK
jgi:hypothetical protein